MNSEEIEIKVIAGADRDSVKKLYQEAGWWQERRNPGWLRLDRPWSRQSFCFVGAFSGAEMIGMGRAVSDGVSDAYIQDVVVLKKFRGRGIGAAIIKKSSVFKIAPHRLDRPDRRAWHAGVLPAFGVRPMEGIRPCC